jgi:hypothetical protein
MRIDVTQLDLSEPFGQGGQGAIYEIDPTIAHAVGWSGPVVAKLYKQRLPEAARLAFLQRVQWAQSLAPGAREELYRAAAWPLMVIEERGALAGIVMPDEREHFAALFHAPSGATESVLMSLDHVLGEDAYIKRRFGLFCDTRVRAALGERLAAALAVLHKHAIVASDISQANLLVRLTEPYSVTFIDCDSMTFQGASTLKLVETPDWELPREWNEPATTRGADAYKLGLAIMRLFARDRLLHDPRPAEPYVPTALHPLLRAALGSRPDLRPSAGRWQAALRDVLGTPLSEDFPGPPPKGGARRPAAWPPEQMALPVTPPPPVRLQGRPLTGTVAGLNLPTAAAGPPPSPSPSPSPSPPSPVTAASPPAAAAATPPFATGSSNRRPPTSPPRRTRSSWRRPASLVMLALIVFTAIVALKSASGPSSSATAGSNPAPAPASSRRADSGRRPARTPRRASDSNRRRTNPRRSTSDAARAGTEVRDAARASNSSSSSAHSSPSPPRTEATHTSTGASPVTHVAHTPSHASPPPSEGLQGGQEHAPASSGEGQGGASGLEGAAQGESSSGGGEGGLTGGASR